MLVKPCEFCGVEFDATPSGRASNPPKRFCSRVCNNKSRGRKPIPPHEFFQRPCERCGEIFDSTPSRPAYEPPKRFCSACFHKGRAKVNRRRVEKACEQCGKVFEIYASWAKKVRCGKHTGRFCSRSCAWESQKHPRLIPHQERTDGTMVNGDGYVMRYMPDHPTILARKASGSKARSYVLEHRLVMEKKLGRLLLPTESVHHLDGNRQNNDPANLELWVKPQPSGVREKDVLQRRLDEALERIKALESKLEQLHQPS